MLLFDINVLVYAHRPDMEEHVAFRRYVESTINGGEPVAIPDFVMAGFLRIVTNNRVFSSPTPVDLAFSSVFVLSQHTVPVGGLSAGGWSYFQRVCVELGLKGSTVSDGYLGALAFDNRATLVTADSDFALFPELTTYNPADAG